MRIYKKGKVPSGLDTIYIGRGSKYGNPFIMGEHGTRSEVIAQYKNYALSEVQKDSNWLSDLRGKDGLVCYCYPLPCHGEVLVELLESEHADGKA